jgi:hypothetical protein
MDRNDTYIDYEAYVQLARYQRSVALGDFIASGWHQLKAMMARLLGRTATLAGNQLTDLPA